MTISPLEGYFIQKQLQVAIDDLIVARFSSSKDLRDNADIVAELLRDSVEEFALRTGLSVYRFHEAYCSAVRITLATLDKPLLRGVCRFQAMPVRTALRWLKSRLLNNVRTVLTDPRSSEWLGHFDREYVDSITFGDTTREAELAHLTEDQVLKGLHELFKDGSDVGELEYLAERFGIDIEKVIGRHEVPVICEKTMHGNAQLAFDWGV